MQTWWKSLMEVMDSSDDSFFAERGQRASERVWLVGRLVGW